MCYLAELTRSEGVVAAILSGPEKPKLAGVLGLDEGEASSVVGLGHDGAAPGGAWRGRSL